MFNRDALIARIQDHIDRFGWSVTAVVPTYDDPCTPFAYTVGLTEHAHPELVIAGLDPITSQALLNDVADRVVHRQARFDHGRRLHDLLAGYDAIIIGGVATDALHPGAAHARYGSHRVRLQQIVWPDRDGRFPWQAGYAYPPQVQPLLRQP